MTTRSAEKNAPKRNRTLKTQLLWWLIPTLVFVMMGALWLSNHQLRNQVDIAYDRSLSGALRAIDHNISTASGGLAMEQPYLMLEFFELTANGSVFTAWPLKMAWRRSAIPTCPCPRIPWSPASRVFSTRPTRDARQGRGAGAPHGSPCTRIKGADHRAGGGRAGDPASLPAPGAGTLRGTRPGRDPDQRLGDHPGRFHGLEAPGPAPAGSGRAFCGRFKPRQRFGHAR